MPIDAASIDALLATMPATPAPAAEPVSPTADIDAKLALMPTEVAPPAPVAAEQKEGAPPAPSAPPEVPVTSTEPAKLSTLERARQRHADRLKAATDAEVAKRAKETPTVVSETLSKEEVKALAATDPLKAIELLGLDPADFVSSASAAFLGLRANEEEQEKPAAPVVPELPPELQQELAEWREWKKTAQANLHEQQQAQVISTVAAEIAPLQEKHPAVAKLGDAAAKSVWGVMASYHAQYGVLPPVTVALKYLNDELQAQAPASATKPKSDVTPQATASETKPALQDAFKDLPLDPRARMKAMLALVDSIELPAH